MMEMANSLSNGATKKGTLKIDTTEVKNFCNNFNSKMTTIDLGSLDISNAFEPFTSQGILTDYVNNLKKALSTITEKSTSITTVLTKFADTQENIDNAGKRVADANSFSQETNPTGDRNNYNSYNYNSQETSVNNGNSEIGINSKHKLMEMNHTTESLVTFKNLSSLLEKDISGATEEEKEAYQNELSKLKIQVLLTKIDKKETKLDQAEECVTYDVLKQISEELNIELIDILGNQNIEDVKTKVENISQEYINIFNSNNLSVDLKNIYEGNNTTIQDQDFIYSIKNMVDLIAKKENISVEDLLQSQNNELLMQNIGIVKQSLEKLKTTSTSSNKEFIDTLKNIFKIDLEQPDNKKEA